MRHIVFLCLGFAATCGLYLYTDSWIFRMIGVGITVLFSAVVEKKHGMLRRMFVTLLGCILGFAWCYAYSTWYLRPISHLDDQNIESTILASDYSRETTYGSAVDGSIRLEEKTYRVTLYLRQKCHIEPGDSISGLFRLKITTQPGEETSSYFQGKGVFVLAYQKGEVHTNAITPSFRQLPAVLRHRIQELLEHFIPNDCVAFAKALLLGDTSGLSYQTDTNLKISGIRHIVAVSGLHVAILFAILNTVTFRKRFLTAFVGLPVLLLFSAVSGFTPSVMRACIMAGLMLLSQLVNKEYDGPSALSFAVLVMLAINPYCIRSVSFQLSVASVTGILLFAPRVSRKLTAGLNGKKGRMITLLRKAASGIGVTLGAQIMTIPLCAYYFGVVSLIGVITNLLVLWVVSLTFCLLTAICVFAPVFPTVARIVGIAATLLIRYVLLVAKTMASFPLAAVYTNSPYVVLWLVFVYLLLLAYLKFKRMSGDFVCCAVLSLCLALIISWWEPRTSDIRFTMLNVGQGQCLLIQSMGRVYEVDCGGDSEDRTADLLSETLLSQGYSHVDGIILTHMDRDHAGGVEGFLSRIPTDLLVLPHGEADIVIPEKTQVVIADQDIRIADENATITVFVPVFSAEENEKSLCVLFDSEKCDILVTGDRNAFGERSLLRHADIPKVDILIAGHHGSRYSTCEALLDAAMPDIVCISAGEDNPYGHPAQELLGRLEKYGCTVYRTDRQGTITIRR